VIALYGRVIVTARITAENLVPGDVGTVVEEYRDAQVNVIGYELELFSADGHTWAMCSVPASAVREATPADRLCSRIAELSTTNPTDRSDPIIDEIRAVRHRISEQFGHDPQKLAQHYMQLQERHKDRLVRSTGRASDRGP
jgi:hypothetical protein